jgi:glutathione-regulated potassium-efflux system ancillary protein KefF
MADVLVLAAHPQMARSRVTRRLMHRAAAGPDGALRAEVRDLYALYPDYWIDVPAEQTALARARLVVWLHPVHWYGMPPLLKLWLDETFAFGWAYGPGGAALAGKSLWLVASTGGPADSYRPDGHNRHAWADFLPPYTQTAALAGMRWLPPLVLHGAHRADEAALAAHEARFAQLLRTHAAEAAVGVAGIGDAAETAAATAPPRDVVPADTRPGR